MNIFKLPSHNNICYIEITSEEYNFWLFPCRFVPLSITSPNTNDEKSAKCRKIEIKELILEAILENSEKGSIESLIKNYEIDDDFLKSSIQLGRIDVIKTLIKNRYNIEAKHIEYAVKFNALGVIEYLINEKYEINYIRNIKLAMEHKNKKMINILLKTCPNEQLFMLGEKNGNSLLHEAARFGHLDLVKKLIDGNEDFIYIQNNNKQQAVHWIGIDDFEIGKLLITEKNINSIDENKWTPLHYFVSKNHFELAKYVIEKGASIDEEDSLKESPLHMACTKGFYEMVELLIENKADINKIGILTPLMASIESDNFDMDIVYLLLSYNVDTTIKVFGVTALHIAIQTGIYRIVEALVNEKKSIDIEDDDGNTPLDLARLNKASEIIKILLYKNAKSNNTHTQC